MAASRGTLEGSSPDRGRVPDFFIVGHHKCGTTALYEMLKRHPQTFMSPIKEPRFLASDMRSRFQQERGHRLPETLDEYLALFAGARPDQLVGEATPSYLFSKTAAASIAELQPAARCIAILREPAAFLRSLHMQLLRSHVEIEADLGKAIALEDERAAGRRIPARSHQPQLLAYSDHVRYADQLRRYHAVLPDDQVLVLIYDDFRADNEAALRTVTSFLGLDGEHELESIEIKRTVRAMRSQRADDILRSVTQGSSPPVRAARASVKAITPRRLRYRALGAARRRAVFREPPPADERVMNDLRRRYRPEVEAISSYLGRDLVRLWGYDALD
jgi:hypothetical protein